ncbi:MAG: hypothetical protein WCC31_05885 [Terracidiphilus sp.]
MLAVLISRSVKAPTDKGHDPEQNEMTSRREIAMSTEKKTASSRDANTASPALRRIGEIFVGAWNLSGGATGTVRFEWAEGGLFLIQRVDLTVFGRKIKGVEMIGHLHRIGEDPSDDIWTRFYSFGDGLTLDYVYELTGRTLTIWFMKKGSDSRYVGEFSKDGNSFKGAWAWPGGGYEVTGTRVR